jgi:hypothetical protein
MKSTHEINNQGKIFGIGLSKTGTTSLNKALELLGYTSWHDPRELLGFDEDMNLRLSGFTMTQDALTDTTPARFFRELDSRYPNSKFILTTRDVESWLKSCKNFWKINFNSIEDRSTIALTDKLHIDLYNSAKFNKSKFKKGYMDHTQNVLAHFKDRKNNLLVLNISDGDGWDKLCPFLNKPIPSTPFPNENKRDKTFTGFMIDKYNDVDRFIGKIGRVTKKYFPEIYCALKKLHTDFKH